MTARRRCSSAARPKRTYSVLTRVWERTRAQRVVRERVDERRLRSEQGDARRRQAPYRDGSGPERSEWSGSGSMSDAIRVALLGCGVVGSQVVRLLDEQADDLAARVGAPLELAGIAVRRPARHHDLPADLVTTDAYALVARDDVDVVVEVLGGSEPVRSVLLAA